LIAIAPGPEDPADDPAGSKKTRLPILPGPGGPGLRGPFTDRVYDYRLS